MRFSIVTPVLNGMPWLPEAVASVQRQRAEVKVEHIILDGGSTDGSRQWLETHAASDATLVLEPDAGQTDALIRGLRRASGDVLGWLNADDILEPQALLRVAKALKGRREAVGASGAALLIDPRGDVVGGLPTPPCGTRECLLRHPHNPTQPATFFRRDIYEAVGGLNPSLDLAMDADLWLRLTTRGPFELLKSDVLARFRVHPSAKSVRHAGRAAREDLRVRLQHGMPLVSYAGATMVKFAYVYPALAPAWRATVGRLRRHTQREEL